MPTYEFECDGCSVTRDVVASIFDDIPDHFCEYDGYKMHRVYTPFGVKFNAQGFYSTDRRT